MWKTDNVMVAITCDYNYLLHFITVVTLLFVCFLFIHERCLHLKKKQNQNANNQKEPVAAAF